MENKLDRLRPLESLTRTEVEAEVTELESEVQSVPKTEAALARYRLSKLRNFLSLPKPAADMTRQEIEAEICDLEDSYSVIHGNNIPSYVGGRIASLRSFLAAEELASSESSGRLSDAAIAALAEIGYIPAARAAELIDVDAQYLREQGMQARISGRFVAGQDVFFSTEWIQAQLDQIASNRYAISTVGTTVSPTPLYGWEPRANVGGIVVWMHEIRTAEIILNNAAGVMIKQPLAKFRHPLADCDYRSVVKTLDPQHLRRQQGTDGRWMNAKPAFLEYLDSCTWGHH